jgi:hypothetical protein
VNGMLVGETSPIAYCLSDTLLPMLQLTLYGAKRLDLDLVAVCSGRTVESFFRLTTRTSVSVAMISSKG